MALTMVHLGVAKELAALVGRNIHDLSQYYMGVIAPDAFNLRKGKTSNDRNISHICRVNFPPHDLWCQDILAYFKTIQDAPSADFCLGYKVHLLTDSFWYATLFKTFEANYQKDPYPIQGAYYNATCRLDIELYDILAYRDEIWQHLKNGKGETLPDLVSASEVEAERDRTLYWYDGAKSRYTTPARYITIEDELDFIRKASQFIYQLCFLGGDL